MGTVFVGDLIVITFEAGMELLAGGLLVGLVVAFCAAFIRVRG